jgi:hypothetical protein
MKAFEPDCESSSTDIDLAILAGCHISCTVDVRKGTGGAGIPNDASIICSQNPDPNKKRLTPFPSEKV